MVADLPCATVQIPKQPLKRHSRGRSWTPTVSLSEATPAGTDAGDQALISLVDPCALVTSGLANAALHENGSSEQIGCAPRQSGSRVFRWKKACTMSIRESALGHGASMID
jgi:hypothetical protein